MHCANLPEITLEKHFQLICTVSHKTLLDCNKKYYLTTIQFYTKFANYQGLTLLVGQHLLLLTFNHILKPCNTIHANK